jgi:glycerol uptake facilitator-like aquaporin
VARHVVAEALGTAFLLAAVVGSGIMGERLAGGNVAIALLANTIATGAALVTLILTFGPISGAHFNPAVTLADASQGWYGVARRTSLPRRSNHWRVCRSCGRAHHVRRAGVFPVAAH